MHTPAAEPAEPPVPERRRAGADVSERWVPAVRRYLASWGLLDDKNASVAARRLVVTVLSEASVSTDAADVHRQLLRRTRQWVEEFVGGVAGDEAAIFRGSSLLGRFPRAFVASPIPPDPETAPRSLGALPAPAPLPMMQQGISDAVEIVTRAVREAVERVRRGARAVGEAQGFVEPMP